MTSTPNIWWLAFNAYFGDKIYLFKYRSDEIPGICRVSVAIIQSFFLIKGSRKNKFAILGVEAPAWQGAKTLEYSAGIIVCFN